MPAASRRADRSAWIGLVVAVLLVAAAMAVPALWGWKVHVRSFPPLHASWHPRVGVATVLALALAVLAARHAVDLAERLPWGRLLGSAYVVGLVWMLALALVDGRAGI